jgi:YesN/AraC family two-component response regulator
MDYNCKIVKMIPKNNIYGSVVSNGFVAYKHWQPELEFVYVKKGFLIVEIDEEIFYLEETDLLIISSGAIHTFLKSDAESIIYVSRIFIDDIASFYGMKEEFISFYRNTLLTKTTEEEQEIMEKIIRCDYGKYNDCYASAKAAELTVQLILNQRLIKKQMTPCTVGGSEVIIKMQQFIENSLHENITLSMLAKHLGFSDSYCSKFVKKKTNLNFLNYVSAIRLREAEELLRTTDLSVTEIAYSTGFTSIQSFNRIFKSTKGINPTEYRKDLRNKK